MLSIIEKVKRTKAMHSAVNNVLSTGHPSLTGVTLFVTLDITSDILCDTKTKPNIIVNRDIVKSVMVHTNRFPHVAQSLITSV